MTTNKRRREGWRVGRRVCREHSLELGTIIQATNREIKVKWDSGETSYFDRDQPSNVRLGD